VETSPRTVIAALRHSHQRLASLVHAVSEDFLTSQSYCSDWSVAQVLSHLGSGAEIALITLGSALSGGEMDRTVFQPVWDSWNAKTPEQQAADCLPADDAYVSRLEGLTDTQLRGISLDFLGMTLDAAGLVGLRLGEHAMHTWDVAVAVDPVAGLAPDAVGLIAGRLPYLAGRVGRPSDPPFRIRLRGSSPDLDFLLDVGDTVTLVPWPAEGGEPVGAEIRMPAEAVLRLFAGRLDPAHTPPAEITGDAALLDRVRAVFPGY
jgi:uncharacterized protein (TIGR03083 family)